MFYDDCMDTIAGIKYAFAGTGIICAIILTSDYQPTYKETCIYLLIFTILHLVHMFILKKRGVK